jgi:hypothetical protein
MSAPSSPSPLATDPGVPPSPSPTEPGELVIRPRSRSRSPSIAPTLVTVSPVRPRRYPRAPYFPSPALVPTSAPPSPSLWWADPVVPAAPPSQSMWWTEPLVVPSAPSSSGRCPSSPFPGVSACSASSADPSFWRSLRPPLHLSSVSACSAPSAQASSGRCPPLQLSCVSASSAAPQPDLLERFLLNPDIPRSPSPEPAPLLVNVIPFSLSTAWVPERCIINNARLKRGLFVKGRINWPLTIPPFGTPLNDCLHYAVGECRRIIGEGRDFYIGATSDPYNRFWGWEGHKHHHTWRNMWVVCQSTNIGIRRLETEMIDADIGRAHPLCANKAPGGGGIPKVASPLTPYFVYIVDTLE